MSTCLALMCVAGCASDVGDEDQGPIDTSGLSDEELAGAERGDAATAAEDEGDFKAVYQSFSVPRTIDTFVFRTISLRPANTHVCALTAAFGRTAGGTQAKVYVSSDGYWYLYSSSNATAVCYPHTAFLSPACPSGVSCLAKHSRNYVNDGSFLCPLEGPCTDPGSTTMSMSNGTYAAMVNGVEGNLDNTWDGGYVSQSTTSTAKSTLVEMHLTGWPTVYGTAFYPRSDGMVQLSTRKVVVASGGTASSSVLLAPADTHMCFFDMLLGKLRYGDSARIFTAQDEYLRTNWYVTARSSSTGSVTAGARCVELDQR